MPATGINAGDVYACDFGKGQRPVSGMLPVAVVSQRFLNRDRSAVTVVPLIEYSGRPPVVKGPNASDYKLVRIPLEKSYRWTKSTNGLLAYCCHAMTVPSFRLEYIERPRGKNVPVIPKLGGQDLRHIRAGIICSLGSGNLLDHDERKDFVKYVRAAYKVFRGSTATNRPKGTPNRPKAKSNKKTPTKSGLRKPRR